MATIEQIITDAANRYGLDPNDMLRIGILESNLNPTAKNPKSSAGGLFQFIDSTWEAYGGGDKMDPYRNADAAGRYLSDVKKSLTRALGRAPTGAELYLGHQQGPSGAIKILANPNKPAAALVGEDAVRLNAGNANMTAMQFADTWKQKFGAAANAAAKVAAQTPSTAPTPADTIADRNTPYPATRTRANTVMPDGPTWSQFQDFNEYNRPRSQVGTGNYGDPIRPPTPLEIEAGSGFRIAPRGGRGAAPRISPVGPGASLMELQQFQLGGFDSVYDRMSPGAKTLRSTGRMDDIGAGATFQQLQDFIRAPHLADVKNRPIAPRVPQTLSTVPPRQQALTNTAPIDPSNHNPAALQAISEGRGSYMSSNNTLMPTRTISGGIRNTYGD